MDGRSAKRQRTDTNGSSKDKKKNRGQNKNRPIPITREPGPKLCRAWELGRCERGEDKCAYQHGWKGYFEEKPRDVRWPERYLEDKQPGAGQGEGDGEGQEEEGHGYAVYPASRPGAEDAVGMTIDLATKCPVLADLGYCPFGFRCRFAGAHVARISSEENLAGESTNGVGSGSADPKTAGGWRITADLHDPTGVREGWKMGETNWPDSNLLTKLRTDKVSAFRSPARLVALRRDLGTTREGRGEAVGRDAATMIEPPYAVVGTVLLLGNYARPPDPSLGQDETSWQGEM